jgi:hypothetical protein
LVVGYFTEPFLESNKVAHRPVVNGIRSGNDFSRYEDPSQHYIIHGNNGFAKTTNVQVARGGAYSSFVIVLVSAGEYHTAIATPGDSSKPIGLVYNGQYTIIGINATAGSCSFLLDHIAKVNQVMAATTPGLAYQLTVIDPFVAPTPTVWTGAT